MGILNITPDSFYDGGRYMALDAAMAQAQLLMELGADIIDIGGASSRPGSVPPPPDEEIRRVVPVIESIRCHYPEAWIAIDTYRADVAVAAIEAGADIVNDISAGDDDSRMWQVVAHYGIPYVMMHKQGIPQTMQQNPTYGDVVKEIVQYFVDKTHAARQVGIHDIIIDPGFGFGKTIAHNYELLCRLNAFRIFPYPLLVGISRKSMIWKVAHATPEDSLPGTSALHALALQQGADILRVHDVKAARQVISVVERAIQKNLSP